MQTIKKGTLSSHCGLNIVVGRMDLAHCCYVMTVIYTDVTCVYSCVKHVVDLICIQ